MPFTTATKARFAVSDPPAPCVLHVWKGVTVQRGDITEARPDDWLAWRSGSQAHAVRVSYFNADAVFGAQDAIALIRGAETLDEALAALAVAVPPTPQGCMARLPGAPHRCGLTGRPGSIYCDLHDVSFLGAPTPPTPARDAGCTTRHPTHGWVCTRVPGHAGQHVSLAGTLRWGEEPPDVDQRREIDWTTRPTGRARGITVEPPLPTIADYKGTVESSLRADLDGRLYSLNTRIRESRLERAGTPYLGLSR